MIKPQIEIGGDGIVVPAIVTLDDCDGRFHAGRWTLQNDIIDGTESFGR